MRNLVHSQQWVLDSAYRGRSSYVPHREPSFPNSPPRGVSHPGPQAQWTTHSHISRAAQLLASRPCTRDSHGAHLVPTQCPPKGSKSPPCGPQPPAPLHLTGLNGVKTLGASNGHLEKVEILSGGERDMSSFPGWKRVCEFMELSQDRTGHGLLTFQTLFTNIPNTDRPRALGPQLQTG